MASFTVAEAYGATFPLYQGTSVDFPKYTGTTLETSQSVNTMSNGQSLVTSGHTIFVLVSIPNSANLSSFTKLGLIVTNGKPDYTKPVAYYPTQKKWLDAAVLKAYWDVTTVNYSYNQSSGWYDFTFYYYDSANNRTYTLAYVKYNFKAAVTVTIVAPSQSAIQYVCGNNGEQIASGTVSAGATLPLALSYEDGTGGVTVVLTASSFNIDTFSGWTKDGDVVDRWSNPATIKAETSCTLSCAFGSTGGTSTGAILCDRYGAILYGDAGATSTSATIAISATYRDSGHTITWAIHKVGESEGAKSASVTTALSVSKTLAWESGGSGSNMPLYADKKITVLPKLFRVRFNCQVAEHVYDVTIKKNGATIYSETYLSGTFSRTFEL
jgi:hypothetical protein